MSRQRGLLPSGRTRNKRNQTGGELMLEARSAWGKDVPRHVCKIVVCCALCAVRGGGRRQHRTPISRIAQQPQHRQPTPPLDLSAAPKPNTNHTRCVLSFFIKSATDRDGRAMWWQPTLIFEDTRSGHRDGSGMVTQQHLF